MPNYKVLRCANEQCTKFQSQQQKKASKWKCVVCGLGQSVRQVYFESTVPRECRQVVMELNMRKGREQAERAEELRRKRQDERTIDQKRVEYGSVAEMLLASALGNEEKSKWARFEPEEVEQEEVEGERDAVQQDRYNRIVVGSAETTRKRSAQPQPQPPKEKPAPRARVVAANKAEAEPLTKQRYSPYTRAVLDSGAKIQEEPVSKVMAKAAPTHQPGTRPAATKTVSVSEEGGVSSPSRWMQFADDGSEPSDHSDAEA
ncbi:hypothetical protein GGI11_000277 [Coemansia sp. RSA 2049]|nr:hypothetical protein H4217_001863 [Coemansia sp. RSA 1939]KAJ2525147.1 hypothetical protein GGI11_000277 [Coemansia sp. RSA 2049]KAJ2616813.1 hypothetical protein EV177_000875 [Coemansia sp. RSA 1804]KAJ2692015.1 hypothetical protein GGH99_002006 [Coemansia sp. RSA 1285]